MSERFYLNCSLNPGWITLTGPEVHHLTTVCRARPGEEVCLFNGDGHEYPARITHVARREISLEILGIAEPQRELSFVLEVAASVPRGDRSQFLIEKLTELGVTRFVPLTCQRSNTHPRESKPEKLRRYVIEASKQCGRNVLMEIDESTTWTDYVRIAHEGELRIVAHPYHAEAPGNLVKRVKETAGQSLIRVAVGPEGGFTDEEMALAAQHEWQRSEE